MRKLTFAALFVGALFAPEAKAQSAQELEDTFNAFFALGFFLGTLEWETVQPTPSGKTFHATSQGVRFRVPCVTKSGRQGKRWAHLEDSQCRPLKRLNKHLEEALRLRAHRKAREAAALLPPPVEVNAEVTWLPKKGGSK